MNKRANELTFDEAFFDRNRQTLDRLRGELLDARNERGHWEGELSASALSTATAISSLSVCLPHTETEGQRAGFRNRIRGGFDWLTRHQNADGGFGDTDRSYSNVATSYLVLSAWKLVETATGQAAGEDAQQRLEAYLRNSGELDALRARYGKDNTFVVPILTNMAIAGLVDWSEVSALPFEAAVFPQSMYRFLGLPVVSYAVPALVAIGQAKFHHSGCVAPWRWVRSRAIDPSLNVLKRMQPESGGFLEATPLTSFVVMSLASCGRAGHPIVRQGLRFLMDSAQPDGSWPIDTNLATWVTSLATLSLSLDPDDDQSWSTPQLVRWQLSCQYRERHPFTGADPGGWGWTDLSGSVPDADDTPAAMVSLLRQRDRMPTELQAEIDDACTLGQRWLLDLQNRDGGWPTFCRGWGKLPFDRSSTDLTAHAMRALRCFGSNSSEKRKSLRRGQRFLERSSLAGGGWKPLWFGNQDIPGDENPFYGTAKVLVDEGDVLPTKFVISAAKMLLSSMNSDGGFGGGESIKPIYGTQGVSSVEETALVIEALCSLWASREDLGAVRNEIKAAILQSAGWLIEAVEQDLHQTAWPIGFYFAKLWYYERLYPPIFATAALSRVAALQDQLLR